MKKQACIVLALLAVAGLHAKSSRQQERELLAAARAGNAAQAQKALAAGADVNAEDNQGRTALALAARAGSLDLVRLLVGKGATLDAQDKKGDTPLGLAVQAGARDVAGFLLDKGADYKVRNKAGQSPGGLALDKGGPLAQEFTKRIKDLGKIRSGVIDHLKEKGRQLKESLKEKFGEYVDFGASVRGEFTSFVSYRGGTGDPLFGSQGEPEQTKTTAESLMKELTGPGGSKRFGRKAASPDNIITSYVMSSAGGDYICSHQMSDYSDSEGNQSVSMIDICYNQGNGELFVAVATHVRNGKTGQQYEAETLGVNNTKTGESATATSATSSKKDKKNKAGGWTPEGSNKPFPGMKHVVIAPKIRAMTFRNASQRLWNMVKTKKGTLDPSREKDGKGFVYLPPGAVASVMGLQLDKYINWGEGGNPRLRHMRAIQNVDPAFFKNFGLVDPPKE